MWSLGRSALLLRTQQILGLRRVFSPELHTSATLDRARKATRERKRKVRNKITSCKTSQTISLPFCLRSPLPTRRRRRNG